MMDLEELVRSVDPARGLVAETPDANAIIDPAQLTTRRKKSAFTRRPRLALGWLAVIVLLIAALVVGFRSTGLGDHTQSPASNSQSVKHRPSPNTANPTYEIAVRDYEIMCRPSPPRSWDKSMCANFNPKEVVLQASAHGPRGSTGTVWSYFPNGQRPPWCTELVISGVSKTPSSLGGGCAARGSSEVSAVTPQEDEWCSPLNGRPLLWVSSGQVPRAVARIVFHVSGGSGVSTPVTNGWFVLITTRSVPPHTRTTYMNRSGHVIGGGTYTAGSMATC
jgi:hypothetical protein